jgi:hypothetical protein
MKRTFAALVMSGGLVAGLWTPGIASGANTYTSCNVLENRPDRDKSCVQGDPWGGVFIANEREGVRYKLCVRRPDGVRNCYPKQTRRAGKPSVVGFFGPSSSQLVGRYTFAWRSSGEVVDRDHFRLRPEGA